MASERVTNNNSGVSCENCTAACCRAGTLMILSETDHQNNRKAMALRRLAKATRQVQPVLIQAEGVKSDGTKYPIPMLINIPAHHGAYVMSKDCGRLKGNRCGIYDDRPQACKDYIVGSPECLEARAAAGLDQEEVSE